MISDTESKEYLYGPKTSTKEIYKLNNLKDINLKFDNLKTLVITSVDESDVTLKVYTDLNEDIEKLVNIRADSTHDLDISVRHKRGKKSLESHIHISLNIPQNLWGEIEIEGNVEMLTIYHSMQSHTEFSGEVNKIMLYDLKGKMEIDTNSHFDMIYDGSLDQLDINQRNSSSNVMLAKGADTYIYSASKTCDVVLIGCVNNPDSLHLIELNGKSSHLIARNE